MNAKEFLKRPMELEKQMERIEEEIVGLESSATETRLIIPTGKYREASLTPMEDALVMREVLEEELRSRLDEWRRVYRETSDALDCALGWKYFREETVLSSRYILGCSWKEIAEGMRRSESTVMLYGRRGLELLQQYLDEKEKGGAA